MEIKLTNHPVKKCFVLLVFFPLFHFSNAQPTAHNQNLKLLDEGFFKWKRFSFVQQWDTLKTVCDLEKLDAYPDFYMDFYCGAISDTSKSYALRNPTYQNFNHFQFDQAVLHLVGSKASPFNCGNLVFAKKFDNASEALGEYHELLASLKKTYGDAYTELYRKVRQESIDSATQSGVRAFLNDTNPFDAVEETEWKGGKYVYMRLHYVAEDGLIILVVNEYATNVAYRSFTDNLYAASEYDEHFTSAFRDFDRKDGFKQLKFGMSRNVVKTIVRLKPTSHSRYYTIDSGSYNHWYDMEFNSCELAFNKKDNLDVVSLFKIDFTDVEYNKLLNDMYDLLGKPTNFNEVSGGSEFSRWVGRKIQLIVLRGDDNTITVEINCPAIDDSSPSDKLY